MAGVGGENRSTKIGRPATILLPSTLFPETTILYSVETEEYRYSGT